MPTNTTQDVPTPDTESTSPVHVGPASPSPRASRAFTTRRDSDAPRLLVVDDEELITKALARYLGSRGYEVATAGSGPEALALLSRHRFALMLCDVRMPGLSGLEVVPKALEIDPDLAIMMLTGVNDAPTATGVLATGAIDYLLKPVELPDLQQAIERALHRRGLEIDRRAVERMIREEVASRTDELEREQQALRTMTIGTMEALVNAMEAKDVYLRGHSQRVAELSASIAAELQLDVDTVEYVRLAARIHDIGKIGIHEAVLNKPGPLTREEFEHVKNHVRIGMEILAPLKHLGRALDYVQDHHEHWDGQGYPNSKSGEDISIGGRILAAADAFDALTSQRAYRVAKRPRETVQYLAARSGDLLDPRVYEAMANVILRQKSLVGSFIED
jgi:putative two-component system response regulator